MDNMAQRGIEEGKDSAELGSWVWARLQWKNHDVTLLSSYRQCKARVLLLNQEPISQFLIDLNKCMQYIQETEDMVIVGMHLNNLIERFDG